MNNSQQAAMSTTSPGLGAADDARPQWCGDDDVVLGCECANPALQIERWGQEAPALMQQPC